MTTFDCVAFDGLILRRKNKIYILLAKTLFEPGIERSHKSYIQQVCLVQIFVAHSGI